MIQANIEIQPGPGGANLVVQNPETGGCVIIDPDSDEAESLENVFGDEVFSA